jgi:hypothetical protein
LNGDVVRVAAVGDLHCRKDSQGHILRACAAGLDWPRLLARFGDHWRVLLQHLVGFGFVYPCERARVPAAVMRELMGRLDRELTRPAPERVCRGTLISRAQYLVDVEHWGYGDPRLAPAGNLTSEERERWTAGIAADGNLGGNLGGGLRSLEGASAAPSETSPTKAACGAPAEHDPSRPATGSRPATLRAHRQHGPVRGGGERTWRRSRSIARRGCSIRRRTVRRSR